MLWGTLREGRAGLNVHSTEGKGLLQEEMTPLGHPGSSQEAWKVARAADGFLPLPKVEQGLQVTLSTL